MNKGQATMIKGEPISVLLVENNPAQAAAIQRVFLDPCRLWLENDMRER